MTHHLKISSLHYEEILSGRKNFEIRFNLDRHFKIGDTIHLREYLGKHIIPSCPDRYCCNGREYDERQGDYYPCPLGRDCCLEYTNDIYSGNSIYAKIIDIFDISDIMPNYVAFTFKIFNIIKKR